MTASWMLASTIVATVLACAALALARVAALYRKVSLRWVWVLATVASLSFALVWLRPARATSAAFVRNDASSSAPASASRADVAPTGRVAPLEPLPARHLSVIELPYVSRLVERALFLGWMTVSAVFMGLLTVTTIRLHGERKQWTWRDVANTRVLVSGRFGPAIVGVRNPEIVLPAWVLELDEPSQRAIVAHEEEHRSARDPALLLAGLAAVVLMPWNIGLWMSWRGMRRAIELDCDARVLARGVDGGEYARVLLGAWKSAHASWLPSTAFAERASGLGARVEHLMRPEPRRRVMRTVVGTILAAGLVVVACVTPSPQRPSPLNGANAPYPLIVIDGVQRPDLPPLYRYTGAVVPETTTTPTYRITYRGSRVEDTVAQKLYPSMDEGAMMQTIDAPASVVHFGEAARYGAVLYYTRKYRAAGGPIIAPTEGNMSVRAADPATPASDMVGAAYANMLNGITLAPDRAAQARTIIETESARQRALRGPALATWPLRIALNATRDAELRALLTSDADRAKFDVRSLESRPHVTVAIEDIERMEYNNLFLFPNENRPELPGPTLGTDAQARARAIIRTAINDEMVLYARAPNAWDDMYDQRLAIRLKRDADLRALLPTDAEKAKFDKFAKHVRGLVFPRP